MKMRTIGLGHKIGHRIGMGPQDWNEPVPDRTGMFDRVVDRYRDEPDQNYRDGNSVPSRPTICRDRT
ncbi:hypothetical protein H5410_017143 [Solanum commersonii]|uniref:Uncharacterized protein n=1 Tax=Solanum commersonii TaxID=4109 RepID=A0A9J5ZZN8_SOLCO|nr:hypothetical protein H5410_017143 [Solanum commersonii]